MNRIKEMLETLRAYNVAQATFSESGGLTAVTFFDGPPLPANPEPGTVTTDSPVGRDGLTKEQQVEQYGTAFDDFDF